MGKDMSKVQNLIKTCLLTFLIIGAFLGSWLFIQKKTKERQAQAIAFSKGKPDGFTNKIVYRDIDQEGHLTNELTSDQLTHFPQGDSAKFTLPQFIVHGEGKQKNTALLSKKPWVITAKRAETLPGNKVIKLYGNVCIDKEGDPNDPEKHLRTEELTFHLKENRLETGHPVLLWQPDANIHATGLIADLNKDIVHFLADTKIWYKPANSKNPDDTEKYFETQSLTFHPKTNLAETKDPVILEQAGTTVYATGLKADLKRNAVTFLSKTKIIYTPNKNHPPKKLP